MTSPNSRRTNGTALRALSAELGASRPVADLDKEVVIDRLGGWIADAVGHGGAGERAARRAALGR